MLPGTYAVRVTVPGTVAPLSGRVVVEADPLPRFSASDRAARQALLMRVYDWTKSLGLARAAARALTAQRDSIATDIGAGAMADSLRARITRVSTDVDRAFTAVNGVRGPIEGWSGTPSVDQRKALDYAIDDARASTTLLNRLIATDIPSAYKAVNKSWGRAVARVVVPGGVAPTSSR